MFGQLIAIGRITEPEMRYTPSGTAVATFSLAISGDYNKDGEWVKKTTWVKVKTWGKLAEFAAGKKKGDLVLAVGTLEPAEGWLKQGEAVAGNVMTASTLRTLTKAEGAAMAAMAETAPIEEEDIPF